MDARATQLTKQIEQRLNSGDQSSLEAEIQRLFDMAASQSGTDKAIVYSVCAYYLSSLEPMPDPARVIAWAELALQNYGPNFVTNQPLAQSAAQAHDAAAFAYAKMGRDIKAHQHRSRSVTLQQPFGGTLAGSSRGIRVFTTSITRPSQYKISVTGPANLEAWLQTKTTISVADLDPAFGEFITNDQHFCEEAVERLGILKRKLAAGLPKPENLLLEAEPGTGKSFFVKQFAAQLPNSRFLERNLSSYTSLEEAFKDIVLDVFVTLLSKQTAVLFIDEVDSEIDGEHVFQRLIAPINGDEFFFLNKQFTFSKQNLICFYAMSSTQDHIRGQKKGPDFLSRIPEHHQIKLPTLNDLIELVYRAVSILTRREPPVINIEGAALAYIGHQKWGSSRALEQALELAKSRWPGGDAVLTLEHVAVSGENVREVRKEIFDYPDQTIQIVPRPARAA